MKLSILPVIAVALAVLSLPVRAQPVATEGGMVEGTVEGSIRVFRSIPYAAPPVGDLRWRAPEPAPAWPGVRKADAFSPICPQEGAYPPESPAEPMSEDCLTLNIWTPAVSASEKLPVMVWIYGGGLLNGSASTPLYAGDQLAKRGVIVVTFNYRLGVFGFLSHPDLNRETQHGASGNYGFLDQVAALNWVRRNIAAFGGDPDQVTIFGQSSGSMSVSALIASPLAKGLFQRAIGQSGGIFEPVEFDPRFTPDGAAEAGERFAARAGATTIAELRAMPAEDLLKVPFHPQFNIDGFALTKSPYDAYAANEQNDVDILVGANADEGQWFLAGTDVTVATFNDVLAQTFPSWLIWFVGVKPGADDEAARAAAAAFETDMRFRWDMWAWARHAVAARGKVYFYQFSKAPPFREGDPYFGLGATHGMEMPYVFDHLDQQAVEWTAKDRELASVIPSYWTNFAKTGDPNGDGLSRWPEFAAGSDQVMNLGEEIEPIPIPDLDRLQRIDNIYRVARFVAHNTAAAIALALAAIVALLLIFVLTIRQMLRFAGASRR